MMKTRSFDGSDVSVKGRNCRIIRMRVFCFKTRSFKSPCMKYWSETERNLYYLGHGGLKQLDILPVCSLLPSEGRVLCM